jgi:hypothetical protein
LRAFVSATRKKVAHRDLFWTTKVLRRPPFAVVTDREGQHPALADPLGNSRSWDPRYKAGRAAFENINYFGFVLPNMLLLVVLLGNCNHLRLWLRRSSNGRMANLRRDSARRS